MVLRCHLVILMGPPPSNYTLLFLTQRTGMSRTGFHGNGGWREWNGERKTERKDRGWIRQYGWPVYTHTNTHSNEFTHTHTHTHTQSVCFTCCRSHFIGYALINSLLIFFRARLQSFQFFRILVSTYFSHLILVLQWQEEKAGLTQRQTHESRLMQGQYFKGRKLAYRLMGGWTAGEQAGN